MRYLLIVCLMAGCSSAPEPTPMLGAVGFEGLNLVVVNSDVRPWVDATLTINPEGGGYSVTVPEIRAGERYSMPAANLSNAAGERFQPLRLKPVTFRVTATVEGRPLTWTTPFTYGTP